MIFDSLSSCLHIFKDFFLSIYINSGALVLITLEAQSVSSAGVSDIENRKDLLRMHSTSR